MISHKFNAVQTEYNGIKFPSKKEAKFYKELKLRRDASEVLFFLRQVPFHLDGGIKYVVDFVIFWTNGTVSFVDVKGYKTSGYIMKKRLVEAKYPIKIEEH